MPIIQIINLCIRGGQQSLITLFGNLVGEGRAELLLRVQKTVFLVSTTFFFFVASLLVIFNE
jgi:Na+-driven multidrug efflux pump